MYGVKYIDLVTLARLHPFPPCLFHPVFSTLSFPPCLFQATSSIDVWSFGVTVWEIATLGLTPYSKIPTAGVEAHVMGGAVLDIAAAVDEVPELSDVIHCCLNREIGESITKSKPWLDPCALCFVWVRYKDGRIPWRAPAPRGVIYRRTYPLACPRFQWCATLPTQSITDYNSKYDVAASGPSTVCWIRHVNPILIFPFCFGCVFFFQTYG